MNMVYDMQRVRQAQQQQQQRDPFTAGLLANAPQMPPAAPPPMTYFPGYGPNGVAGAPPAPPMQSGGGK